MLSDAAPKIGPPEDRGRQILDATLLLIGQRGYYGFSIREVAERCGITVAGVLHHFRSKIRLLVALLEDRHEQDAVAIMTRLKLSATVAAASLALEEALGILREVVLRNSRQPDVVRLYSMLRAEALFPDHPAFEYFAMREKKAQEIVMALIDGKVKNSRSTSLHIIAVMNGLESLWLRDPKGFNLVEEWSRAAERIFGLAES